MVHLDVYDVASGDVCVDLASFHCFCPVFISADQVMCALTAVCGEVSAQCLHRMLCYLRLSAYSFALVSCNRLCASRFAGSCWTKLDKSVVAFCANQTHQAQVAARIFMMHQPCALQQKLPERMQHACR